MQRRKRTLKTATICASLAALGAVVPAAPAAAKTYVPLLRGQVLHSSI